MLTSNKVLFSLSGWFRFTDPALVQAPDRLHGATDGHASISGRHSANGALNGVSVAVDRDGYGVAVKPHAGVVDAHQVGVVRHGSLLWLLSVLIRHVMRVESATPTTRFTDTSGLA